MNILFLRVITQAAQKIFPCRHSTVSVSGTIPAEGETFWPQHIEIQLSHHVQASPDPILPVIAAPLATTDAGCFLCDHPDMFESVSTQQWKRRLYLDLISCLINAT